MPAAVPLVGAAFSISAGIAAGATTLVGGLMIAGGAMTAVGTVTGNKKLQTLGAVLGLAGGGIGAFNELTGAATAAGDFVGDAASRSAISAADSAAATAASAPVAETAAQVAAGASAAPAMDAIAAADYAAGLIPAGQPGAAAMDGVIGGAVRDPWAMAGPGEAAMTSPGQAAVAVEPSRVGDWAAPQQAVQAPQPAMSAAPDAVPMTANRYDLQQGTYSGRGPESFTGPDATGWWDRAKQFGQDASAWMRQNPEITKLAGGLVGGAAKYFGDQQLAEDNARRQMAYQDWVRQRYSDSVRNLQVPRLNRTAAAPGGIIGGARG